MRGLRNTWANRGRRLQPTRYLEITTAQRRTLRWGWALVPALTTFGSIKIFELADLAANGTPTGQTPAGDYLVAWLMASAAYPLTVRAMLRLSRRRERKRTVADQPAEGQDDSH